MAWPQGCSCTQRPQHRRPAVHRDQYASLRRPVAAPAFAGALARRHPLRRPCWQAEAGIGDLKVASNVSPAPAKLGSSPDHLSSSGSKRLAATGAQLEAPGAQLRTASAPGSLQQSGAAVPRQRRRRHGPKRACALFPVPGFKCFASNAWLKHQGDAMVKLRIYPVHFS